MMLVQSFHKLSVAALITCAAGCGLDAAYAAFTTSTTSTGGVDLLEIVAPTLRRCYAEFGGASRLRFACG